MKLNEFYNPEEDKLDHRSPEDTRKPVLTLKELNKLRKYREIKKAENIDRKDFIRTMYAQPAASAGGL